MKKHEKTECYMLHSVFVRTFCRGSGWNLAFRSFRKQLRPRRLFGTGHELHYLTTVLVKRPRTVDTNLLKHMEGDREEGGMFRWYASQDSAMFLVLALLLDKPDSRARIHQGSTWSRSCPETAL